MSVPDLKLRFKKKRKALAKCGNSVRFEGVLLLLGLGLSSQEILSALNT